jgi:hypothetical protein
LAQVIVAKWADHQPLHRQEKMFERHGIDISLHLIARLYAVEERAKAVSLPAEQRLALRQRVSSRLLRKLHQYLLELQAEVLPKSPSGAAVRYALNQWEALTRFLEDGELEIDNGATERANRDIALGRGNWTFFGSDAGGVAKLYCLLQEVPCRAVCLVSGCALTDPGALYYPSR